MSWSPPQPLPGGWAELGWAGLAESFVTQKRKGRAGLGGLGWLGWVTDQGSKAARRGC